MENFVASSSQIFVSAYADSDLFGRLIIIALCILSALCWLVLIQKAWQNKQVRGLCRSFQEAIAASGQPLLSLTLDEFPKPKYPDIPHPYAEILSAIKTKTVDVLQKNQFFLNRYPQEEQTPAVFLTTEDLNLIETEAANAMSKQCKQLEKNLFVLSTVVTLAPFLGLLGTVWGILLTFSALHSGASSGSSTMILGGLSTALATTVLGLVIAIPALISYNILRASQKSLQEDMEEFCYQLLGQIEMEYRRGPT